MLWSSVPGGGKRIFFREGRALLGEAMKTAFDDCWYWVDAFVKHLQGNRDYAAWRLNAMPMVAAARQEATFVTFPDIRATGLTSQQFTDYMFEKQRVALVPGTVKWFGPGAEGHVRLCYSTSRAILREGLDRIETGIHAIAAAR